MDVVEVLRGHGRRLFVVETELTQLRERVAQLEGRPARQPASRGEPRPQQAPPPTGPPQRPPVRPEATPPPRAPRPAGPPPPQRREPAARPETARPRIDLEELLGGRVLGLAGALAVLLGVAFLVAMAVDRGWIDEPTRIAIGFGGCSLLLLVAIYLYERRGQTQAALAAAGAAVAGLFATLTAGAQLYQLFPVPVSLVIAAAIGAAATALALRWNARTFAALGLIGALLAPVLVGAEQSGLTVAFVLFVLTIAVAVADCSGWARWLPLSASIVAAPQVLDWIVDGPDAMRAVLVLSYFWIVNVAAATSVERTRDGGTIHPVAGILLGGASVLVAPAGYGALENLGYDDAPIAWLGSLGAAHIGLGVTVIARRTASRDLAHMAIALGVILADIAFVLAVDGFELAAGWAASAVALVALARVRDEDETRLSLAAGAQLALAIVHAVAIDADPITLWDRPDELVPGIAALAATGLAGVAGAHLLARNQVVRDLGHAVALAMLAYLTAFIFDGTALAIMWAVEAAAVMALARLRDDGLDTVGSLGSGALVGLALTHALTIDARPDELAGPPHDLLAGVASLGAVGLAALLAAQLLPRTGPARAAGHAVTLLVLAYVTAFAIDGPLVAVAWAAEAVAVMALARRGAGGLDSVGSAGAVSLLAFGLLHGLVLDAAPRALVYGVDDLLDAALALSALAAAALALSRLIPAERRDERLGFASVAAAALVYLGSVAIVTPFQPSGDGFEVAGGLLDERQRGQLLLSAFWAVAGVGALVFGLARSRRAVRIGGFVLLGIATTKVFLFDLSTLESLYRVGSFVALGLLLLGGAYAWQRTRALREGPGSPNGGAAGA